MALGAKRESVLRLVAGRTFVLIALGVVVGGGAAVVLGQLLAPALYVPGFDPASLGAGIAVLLLAGVVACVVPARRATSIDPMSVLRQE